MSIYCDGLAVGQDRHKIGWAGGDRVLRGYLLKLFYVYLKFIGYIGPIFMDIL